MCPRCKDKGRVRFGHCRGKQADPPCGFATVCHITAVCDRCELQWVCGCAAPSHVARASA